MRYFKFALVLLLLLPLQILSAAKQENALSQLLDINTANAALLADTLPGIGPAKAALIVQWREQNGKFKHVDQLQEVKGIGPKTLEKLRAYVRVGSEAEARKMQMQLDQQEDKVRADVHRVINAATFAATPESIEALPRKAWYGKSVLEILRTH